LPRETAAVEAAAREVIFTGSRCFLPWPMRVLGVPWVFTLRLACSESYQDCPIAGMKKE
jgi:hypothetical protein